MDLYGRIKLEIKRLFVFLHSRIGFINLISSLKSSSPILTTTHREQFQFLKIQFPFVNQSPSSMHKDAGCSGVRCKFSSVLCKSKDVLLARNGVYREADTTAETLCTFWVCLLPWKYLPLDSRLAQQIWLVSLNEISVMSVLQVVSKQLERVRYQIIAIHESRGATKWVTRELQFSCRLRIWQ